MKPQSQRIRRFERLKWGVAPPGGILGFVLGLFGVVAILVGCSTPKPKPLSPKEALLQAIEKKDEAKVSELLANGLSPNTDCDAQPALHCAVVLGNAKIVERLLKAGADVNLRSRGCFGEKGFVPIDLAARYSSPAVVSLLLKHGADANAKGPVGRSPLCLALRNPHDPARVVRLLLEEGADPSMDTPKYRSIDQALLLGESDIANLLKSARPPADHRPSAPEGLGK